MDNYDFKIGTDFEAARRRLLGFTFHVERKKIYKQNVSVIYHELKENCN